MLGEPITAGYFVKGQISIVNDTGTADITIPISGPKASTTLHVVAQKKSGRWVYSTMQVEDPDGSSSGINLLQQPKGASP